jgi:PKD repeat protein
VFNTSLFAQYTNTIYLDPTNSGDPGENGTIEHPYDSWSDIVPQSNTAYLQKRGTSEVRTSTIMTLSGSQYHDIYIGAYGTGDRPQIFFNSNTDGIYLKWTRRITIEDLEMMGNHDVVGGNRYYQDAVYLSGHTSGTLSTTQTVVKNCKLHRWGCAVTALPFQTTLDTLMIDNCEIFDIAQDGIFVEVDHLTVQNCHIYRVNRQWHTIGHSQTQSGGDGIQFKGDHYLIYNNIVDRSWTGNKFCIIFGATSHYPYRGRIIYNTFYPPKDTTDDDGGDCLFLSYHNYCEVAYNKFIGTGYPSGVSPTTGMASRADTMHFYYNLADSVTGFHNGDDLEELHFFNNTFINPPDRNGYALIAAYDTLEFKNNIVAVKDGEDLNLFNGATYHKDTSNNIIVYGGSATWNTNPGFVDWENQNYRINETSPATNSGSNYEGWYCDLDSITVPQQGVRDIGTYEYSDGGQSNNPPNINNQAFSIEENTINGTQVGMIIATDPDQGQTLTYSILSGNTDNAFQVNSITGELTVNNSEALDYETNPEFNLTVQVQDNGMGALTDQAIVTVNLLDLVEPIANFTANITIVNVGDSIYFQDESLNFPTNWIWQFEGGTPNTSFDENPIVTYDTPGIYNVGLVASNSNGYDMLIKTDYIEVQTNNNPPVANFTANTTMVAAGDSIFFQDESLNLPTNWIWQFEGGSQITYFNENPIVTYNTPGIYNVKLVVLNSNGNDMLIKTDYIEVLAEKKGEVVNNYINSYDDVKYVMNLYPNPTNNFININLPNIDNEKYTIKIYSLFGKMAKEIEFNTTPNNLIKKIDVSDLQKGTYIMQLNGGQTAVRKKFVKF